jgi:hypothetical protein
VDYPLNTDDSALQFFKTIWQNRELWSCFGYGTVELVLNLPAAKFEALQESQKRSLVGLLEKLSQNGEEDLRKRIEMLKNREPEERLEAILELCIHLGL